MDTTPTRHSPNAVLMLAQRLRRWPNIEPTLEKCTMFEGKSSCMSIQVWVSPFRNPHSNTVSLFANQRPAKSQG